MPEHKLMKMTELDGQGERLWAFGMCYQLPESPADDREWFNAIVTADEAVHDPTGIAEAWGSAWPKERTLLFLMHSFGRYSAAYDAATERVATALETSGLATSLLIEVTYNDPSETPDMLEPPF